MQTYIYFIRHGEVRNPKKILYERLPRFSLSENGKLEIENTAKELIKERIEIIYSSPLLRTRQSAEILKGRLNLEKIYFSKKILEIKSSLKGTFLADLETTSFDLYGSSLNGVDGETIEEVSKRMKEFIKKITTMHKGKRIAVVSHGDPIMIVKAQNEGLPLELKSIRTGGFYIQTGGIYLVKI